MKILVDTGEKKAEIVVVFAFSKESKKADKTTFQLDNSHWNADILKSFKKASASCHFDGKESKTFSFQLEDGISALAVGLGNKNKLTSEKIRKEAAKIYRTTKDNYKSATIITDGIMDKNADNIIRALAEGMSMACYNFDRHLTVKKTPLLKEVFLNLSKNTSNASKILKDTAIITSAINFARDLVHEPPNVLNSETYAEIIKKDMSKMENVQIKILGKDQLKKEKMNAFLSVNAGSAYEPRLVHLTYTPKKRTPVNILLLLVKV